MHGGAVMRKSSFIMNVFPGNAKEIKEYLNSLDHLGRNVEGDRGK